VFFGEPMLDINDLMQTDAGKVTIRAELSKPANKPATRELTYELVSED